MNELQIKEVDFQGDKLLAVKDNKTNKIYVAVNHICNALGLDARIQRDKLKEHMTLSKGCTLWGIPSNGGIQESYVIELDYLPLWLASINPAKVSPAIQNKLVEYQLKAKDVLAQAFLGTQQLMSIEDLIILQAQSVKELKEKVQTLEYRIQNLDATNIEGDLQQRLNKLVRKYAFKAGIMHNIAWEHFKQAYNTAYRTNLELLMNNYKEREGIKKLTLPQYLAVTGHLEDAIRVADKMLNDIKTA
ncbi:hypothetical protein BVF91_09680 [Thermoanaerobacterium sp. PSU-2]|uniref:phage antirepressor N-terminal domain-containing protein n=1 Tax=Thermoanaerobacterium sp. PSU-2 TaxID=1930849 RepID=UPI000A230F0B|nr:phage antirepressor N-terminal domain-containing protein [Thermoanaerobacterium sp. PSU-2]ORX22739.1 hypothetical protein BVF91_09680 [Thermoanaerobacterium sp. PSU-2]